MDNYKDLLKTLSDVELQEHLDHNYGMYMFYEAVERGYEFDKSKYWNDRYLEVKSEQRNRKNK